MAYYYYYHHLVTLVPFLSYRGICAVRRTTWPRVAVLAQHRRGKTTESHQLIPLFPTTTGKQAEVQPRHAARGGYNSQLDHAQGKQIN